jgi:hypothetical protein
MTPWDGSPGDMRRLPLDRDTLDRLLVGAIAPEDAPPGYAEIARTLRSAAAAPTPEELAGEREAVATVAAAVRSHQVPLVRRSARRSSVHSMLRKSKVTVLVLSGAFVAMTGLAAAGTLPGAAQDVAHDMLAQVGISVPGANSHAGAHPDTRGSSSNTTGSEVSDTARTTTATGVDKGALISNIASGGASQAGAQGAPDSTKGSVISDIARTTTATGVDKGAEISTAASDGKSQAGQNGGSSQASAPVPAPNDGGTGTADTASGGASDTGTGTADSASQGHSAAGSGTAQPGH